jgi:isopenicillin-N epimerase
MGLDTSHWRGARLLWSLDPGVAFLNHGSFGAVPIAAQRTQQRLRDEVEANPVRFFGRGLADRIVHVRHHLARFLGADPDGTALVQNATAGASVVLRSVGLAAGDEVLITDHGYGAVGLAVAAICRETGAVPVTAAVPFGADDDGIVEAVLTRVGRRTKLAVLDQVTSPTARLFPVAQLARTLAGADVPTLVDGAHVPGMLPVNLNSLGATYWIGNFHKWGCAPRGTAVLSVASGYREAIRSPAVSWDEPAGFPTSFDRPGTQDVTGWLAAPVALHVLATLGWDELRERNVALADHGQRLVAKALGIEPDSLPADPGVSMRIVPLPPGLAATELAAAALRDAIAATLATEVAVNAWRGRGLLRLSGQAYNRPEEYERLADGLPGLLRTLA